MIKETKVISAFPGCGKSYVYNSPEFRSLVIADSDSSSFSHYLYQERRPGGKTERRKNPQFPENYIQYIKDLLYSGTYDYIFVSSHDIVRNALDKNRINYILCYPDPTLKYEYLERYRKRGSEEKFISLLSDKWDAWMAELKECEKYHRTWILHSGQFLSDLIREDNFEKACSLRDALLESVGNNGVRYVEE